MSKNSQWSGNPDALSSVSEHRYIVSQTGSNLLVPVEYREHVKAPQKKRFAYPLYLKSVLATSFVVLLVSTNTTALAFDWIGSLAHFIVPTIQIQNKDVHTQEEENTSDNEDSESTTVDAPLLPIPKSELPTPVRPVSPVDARDADAIVIPTLKPSPISTAPSIVPASVTFPLTSKRAIANSPEERTAEAFAIPPKPDIDVPSVRKDARTNEEIFRALLQDEELQDFLNIHNNNYYSSEFKQYFNQLNKYIDSLNITKTDISNVQNNSATNNIDLSIGAGSNIHDIIVNPNANAESYQETSGSSETTQTTTQTQNSPVTTQSDGHATVPTPLIGEDMQDLSNDIDNYFQEIEEMSDSGLPNVEHGQRTTEEGN